MNTQYDNELIATYNQLQLKKDFLQQIIKELTYKGLYTVYVQDALTDIHLEILQDQISIIDVFKDR